MGNAFSSKKPLKEVMRENKRMVTRAIRELDREKAGLEREEKRLTMEIKKAARENQMSSVKVMAKVRAYTNTTHPVVVVVCCCSSCCTAQQMSVERHCVVSFSIRVTHTLMNCYFDF